MRKILLASTALVALTSVSAMAADVTISGGFNLIYQTDDNNEPTGGAGGTSASTMSSETDVNIKFSNTSDSGITTTLNAGFDENSRTDDASATISGDFGSVMVASGNVAGQEDDNFILSMDEAYNKAGEGTTGTTFDLGGDVGESIGYKLPSIVDGLTIAVQHTNETASESFGYGASYDAGIAKIAYARMATNEEDYTSINLSGSVAGVSFGYTKNTIEDDGTSEDEATNWGVSYTMDAITLAYETGKAKNESGDLDDYKQIAVAYSVAPGITTILTSSEVNEIATAGADDAEQMEIQLKLSF